MWGVERGAKTADVDTFSILTPGPLVGGGGGGDLRNGILLPTGSEERGVLGDGSISVAILLSCQNMKRLDYI